MPTTKITAAKTFGYRKNQSKLRDSIWILDVVFWIGPVDLAFDMTAEIRKLQKMELYNRQIPSHKSNYGRLYFFR